MNKQLLLIQGIIKIKIVKCKVLWRVFTKSKDQEQKENFFKMEIITIPLLSIQNYRFKVHILIITLRIILIVFIIKHNHSLKMKQTQKIQVLDPQ